MKKNIFALLLLGAVSPCCAQDMHNSEETRHLVAQNVSASGNTELAGATIQTITVSGVLTARATTFTTITVNGSVELINCTATAINVQNAVIAPADTPVILQASAVSGNVTFQGAYGKVILRNGATVGGVVNGEIIVQ